MLGQDAPFALVADDDSIISDIIAEAGFRPLEAGTVEEALALLERYADSIRLLFTDVQMSGGRNGFNLARETSHRWPDVHILVASGDIEPAVAISRMRRSSSASPSAPR